LDRFKQGNSFIYIYIKKYFFIGEEGVTSCGPPAALRLMKQKAIDFPPGDRGFIHMSTFPYYKQK